MLKYPKNMLKQFPENIGSTSVTPTDGRLFKVHNNSKDKFLLEEQEVIFHHAVDRLIFMSTRVQWGIHVVLVFLTIWFNNTNKYVWGKLTKILKYLKGVRVIQMTL